MRSRKARITVTVDRELLKQARAVIRAGDAESLSAVLNRGLSDAIAEYARREALRAAISDYEAEFGEITAEDMQRTYRAHRARAVRVRARPRRVRKAG